ncbi:MAG: hypothetical protein M1493_05450 [Firmicutes bacterium]|nr:hypothetical protein [Bacillota bacterium]
MNEFKRIDIFYGGKSLDHSSFVRHLVVNYWEKTFFLFCRPSGFAPQGFQDNGEGANRKDM